jgi:regulatory protein
MADDGTLAPVTWLFGAPDDRVPEPPRSESREPSSAVAFVDESLEESRLGQVAGIDAAEAAEVADDRHPGRFERINNVSMHALARRGMSAGEMADYLHGRGFESDQVELECERLLGVGLLDDHALAETLVRTLRDRKGLGRSALVAELRRRKLDGVAIDEALSALDSDDELVRAIELAERRAPQLRSYDPETARRRLGAFLQRKGYSGSVISTAVARALAPSGGPVFR